MRFGSLFAGIGGIDLGLERTGMRCVWQCEINTDATKILATHWPDIVRHRDIRSLRATRDIDVLCGGFPCQDVSLCGKKAGLKGERSGLFWEFVRVAKETQAPWIILESVPGLLSRNKGQDFQTVLDALGECGYACAYRVFDARSFGVPQLRERVFVVGHLGDWTAPARVVFDAASLRQCARQGGEEQDRTADGTEGGAPFVFQTRIARCKRGLPTTYLPTLTSYEGAGIHSDSKPHVVTSTGIRRLTVTEHERAQGFPDGWTKGLPDRVRRMLIGNAVVPAIAEWLGQRIITLKAYTAVKSIERSR